MNIQELQQKYGDYQIEMRRWFHRHPEASEHEVETAAKIREELDKMGIKWRKCGMETGTMAVIEGQAPGRTIMLRGDIDGLSVTEETGGASRHDARLRPRLPHFDAAHGSEDP